MNKTPRKFSLFPGREPGQSIEFSSISSQWYSRLHLVEKNIQSAMLYNRELDENALARERIEKDLIRERSAKEMSQASLAKLEVNYKKLLTEFETLKKEALTELANFADQSAKASEHEHLMELELAKTVQATDSLRESNAHLQEEHRKHLADLERANAELSLQHAELKKEIELLRTHLDRKAAQLMDACLSAQIAPEPEPEIIEETQPEPIAIELAEVTQESAAEPVDGPAQTKTPSRLRIWLKWWTEPALILDLTDLKFSKQKETAAESQMQPPTE